MMIDAIADNDIEMLKPSIRLKVKRASSFARVENDLAK